MRDVQSLFATGLGQSLAARSVFTNRVSEFSAFSASVDALSESARAPESMVEDLTAPRRNVLVYYGMGGIGKTSLCHELQRRFSGEGAPRDVPRAALRLDFSESATLDIETLVLRLRAAMSSLAPRWPAFDLALADYWERAHPGEALRDYITHRSFLRRLAAEVGLAEQMAESADAL